MNLSSKEIQDRKNKSTFLQCVKKKLFEKCALTIKKSNDENHCEKGNYLAVINQLDRSDDSSKLTINQMKYLEQYEVEYLKLVVDHIMDHPLRELSSTNALNVAKDVKRKKVQIVEAEPMLEKLKMHNWLSEVNNKIRLSPRFLMEMMPYMKKVYGDKVNKCAAVNCFNGDREVIRSIVCLNPECGKHFHLFCAHDKNMNYKCVCGAQLPKQRKDPETEAQIQGVRSGTKRRIQQTLQTSSSEDEDE